MDKSMVFMNLGKKRKKRGVGWVHANLMVGDHPGRDAGRKRLG